MLLFFEVFAPDIGILKEWYGIHGYIDRITNLDDPNGNSPGWYTKVIKYMVVPSDSDVTGGPLVFDPCNLSEPNNEIIYEALKDAVDYGASKGVYSIICCDYHQPINAKIPEVNAFWNYSRRDLPTMAMSFLSFSMNLPTAQATGQE